MKAAVIERPGLDNLKIEELPTPEPGPGEVLVRLRAASLNYRETLTVVGRYGSRQKQVRLTPLSDGAGEVAAVGLGRERWRFGDRVIGCLMPNWQGGELPEEEGGLSLGATVDGCAVITQGLVGPSDIVLTQGTGVSLCTISLIAVLGGAKPDFNLALVVMQNIRLQGVTVGNRDQLPSATGTSSRDAGGDLRAQDAARDRPGVSAD